MRSDLPPNSQQSLDYAATVNVLKLLEGEEVVLFISGGPGEITAGGAEAASRIQAKGVLRHYDYGTWAQGFALGDSARILLYEPDFVSASLQTHDGTNIFTVGVQLVDAAFYLGDPSAQTDEFDLFPGP